MSKRLLLALAGQPNCGKSTIFNSLTGARQHVANYPGVTVEKKTGYFSIGEQRFELVDLPGTYSLASYSLEERVARDFLLHDGPDLVINILDASNIKRGLYLALQLLEMEVPMIMALNMMDVAERRSISIDVAGLSALFNVPVVPTVGTGKSGVKALREEIADAENFVFPSYRLDYDALEPYLHKLEKRLALENELDGVCSFRWLAVKLMEGDAGAFDLLRKLSENADALLHEAEAYCLEFEAENGLPASRHIAFSRHKAASAIASKVVVEHEKGKATLSDRADRIICHKLLGPVILLFIMAIFYQVAIVFGNYLAAKAWPFWETLQAIFAGLLPDQGLLEDPLLRSLGIWVMKSAIAVLNYLPIFAILFSCIAILEDSGYMPRMAFILDRLFRRFGLHGQSTLPLILGGVYVGGCAIPAVMATRAIPDEKARLATIMITPMMNCLAKTPLYLILISAFFPEHSGSSMFFIATVTLFMALPVAKLLSLTVLRNKTSAPFIMEMPPYHLPMLRGVISRAIERLWLFLKKIVTVVLAVAVVVFALISFPGPDQERMDYYYGQMDASADRFISAVSKTGLSGFISKSDLPALFNFEEEWKEAKRCAPGQEEATRVDEEFEQKNSIYFAIVRGKGEDGKALRKAFRTFGNERKDLRRELSEERFENSLLGKCGKALEPVTQYAGFNWKINIALLSAFAAKENSAATLGAIYGIDGNEGTIEENLRSGDPGFTPLHALALMIFMALYPPCIPTSIMVRLQSGSTGWMMFSIIYQSCLGLFMATLIFTGSRLMEFTGLQAMWTFYALCVAVTILLGLIPDSRLKKKSHPDKIEIKPTDARAVGR